MPRELAIIILFGLVIAWFWFAGLCDALNRPRARRTFLWNVSYGVAVTVIGILLTIGLVGGILFIGQVFKIVAGG